MSNTTIEQNNNTCYVDNRFPFTDGLRQMGMYAQIVNGRLNIGPSNLITDKIIKIAKENRDSIIAELLAEQGEDPGTSVRQSRDSSRLMAAIRAKAKLATCQQCGELVEAQEYPQPSEGWHFYDCESCESCGTVCLSEASDQAQRLQAKLDAQGWCLIRSEVLGEPVVIRKAGIKPPEHLDRCISYTLNECALLSSDSVAEVHRLKRQFGGKLQKATKREAGMFR